jgi:hypothetical protein
MRQKYFITVLPSGYGHWKVMSTVRTSGKTVQGTTTNSRLVDRYNELKDERLRGIVSVERELHRIARGAN